MSTVVRVKRPITEEPRETLVLNCKRRKKNNEDANSEEIGAVFQLAATSTEDHDIEHLLRKHTLNIAKLKENFKSHSIDINEKLRTEMRNSSVNSRYRIVNQSRKILNDDETNGEAAAATAIGTSEITVLDLETDSVANESIVESVDGQSHQNQANYTYDYYYTNSDEIEDANFDEMVSINSVNQNLVFEHSGESSSEGDSEDSNAENYWANDYPDEEDELSSGSVNEDDMLLAVNNLRIDDDLSSDCGDIYDSEDDDAVKKGSSYLKFLAKCNNSDQDDQFDYY